MYADSWPHVNILKKSTYILLFIATGALWLLFSVLNDNSKLTVCPSKLIFGFPCPGCGTTHAAKMLLKGDVAGSVMHNPNALLLIVFAVVYTAMAVYDVLRKTSVGTTFDLLFSPYKRKFIYPALLIFEIFVWVKNIIMS